MKRDLYAIIILLLGLGIVLWAYPQLPEQIPSHWNMRGEVDGYTAKPFGAFMNLLIGVAVYLGFYFLAKIDPLKDNYNRFNRGYLLIRDTIITFFVILNLMPVLSGLGYIKDVSRSIFILFSLLMISMGNYMPTFKRNWFLGIKTPWTVSSEEVWNHTHRIGGKLFMLGGLLGLIESIFMDSTYLFLIGVIGASLGSTIYSYWLYKKIGD
ncbi:hypothetical protein U472_11745 [Orenia metallireducens]|uniref:DUF1648 domain-containing protein n=1 Tax=Orenia metallireducens TaxID=1413210 RepID=A0A1C0A931_9FIRM|nr:hypothetical protein U472_11745 [Orenia metallireducens]